MQMQQGHIHQDLQQQSGHRACPERPSHDDTATLGLLHGPVSICVFVSASWGRRRRAGGAVDASVLRIGDLHARLFFMLHNEWRHLEQRQKHREGKAAQGSTAPTAKLGSAERTLARARERSSRRYSKQRERRDAPRVAMLPRSELQQLRRAAVRSVPCDPTVRCLHRPHATLVAAGLARQALCHAPRCQPQMPTAPET